MTSSSKAPASALAGRPTAPPAWWANYGLGARSRTFSSLANPHFRLLWISMLFSFTAIQMSFIAQGLVTFQLTRTVTSLGVVTLGFGLTQLPLSLVGGVAADRLHKRWIVIVSQSILAVASLAAAVLIQMDAIAVWHMFGLSLLMGAVFAFNVPARQAWIPELVEEEHLMNAIALNTAAFTATGIVGPALAGVLIAVPFVDLAEIYYLMAGSFVLVVLILLRVPGGAPSTDREPTAPHRDMLDGLSYVQRHPVLPFLLLMGIVPIMLGMPYRTFFPVFQERVYGVGEGWLGAMGAAMAVGALVGSLWVASFSSTSRRSLVQVVAGVGFGVSLVLFAVAPTLLLGLGALLLVGLTANGYWALNNTMVLGSTDRAYYGRVMSVYMLSWSLMPFAALPEGAIADELGVQATVAGVGVLLAVLLLAIVAVLPGYRRLQEREGAPVVLVAEEALPP